MVEINLTIGVIRQFHNHMCKMFKINKLSL